MSSAAPAQPAQDAQVRSDEQTDPSADANTTNSQLERDSDWSEHVVKTAAEPSPTTAAEAHLGARELSTMPRRTAEDFVELVPGFQSVQHGNEGKGHQFFVRGFDAVHGADVEVRLEGIPLNEPSNVHGNGYLDLAFLIPEAIVGVDARKGTFELRQGPFATAASLDFELGIPGWERGVRTLYEVGSTNRHRLAVTLAPEEGSRGTFAAAEALYDDGFGTNRQTRRAVAIARAHLAGDDELNLSALFAGYAADFGLPGTLRLTDVRDDAIGFYDAYSTDTAGASLRGLAALRLLAETSMGDIDAHVYGLGRRLELDENFTGQLLYPDRGDRRLQREDSWTAGGWARWSERLAATLRLSSLLEWRTVWASQSEDQLSPTGQVWQAARDLDFVEHLGAAGLSVDWSPLAWLRLDGGARLDVVGLDARDELAQASGEQWFVALSPRIAATFFAGLDWTFFAAYGRGLRPPEARAVVTPDDPQSENRDHTRYGGGEPELTRTDNAEIGVKWTPVRQLAVSLTGFGVWIERESVFDHVSGVNVELNATERYGLEAVLGWQPARWIDLAVSATAVEARFVDSGEPVPGAPRLMASARASLFHPDGWRAGLAARAIGVRPLAHGAQAAPLGIVDATLGYRWRWLQLDLQVENALGARWREGEYHYASWWDRSQARSQLPVIHYVAGTPRTVRATLSAWF
ncbi:TonB-dependent receptor [Persicimonas caeni]|uniref:TonB-dependent receptor n=1 Tax=Persicimonas caeni TaxID=2292766 RepID=A0A4Y6PRY8_PERCE|nr:TonB-dependent receptor [Persicimonas caeni]QDG51088.1 TonB-dependent receptor [Persicimonas caeni]QED32309.1 TonB-dependent receptor [Persicimonas caeni]